MENVIKRIGSGNTLFYVHTESGTFKPNSTYTTISIPYPSIDGYSPVGIAGFKIQRSNSMPYRMRADATKVTCSVHNYSTSSSNFNYLFKILYMRNS